MKQTNTFCKKVLAAVLNSDLDFFTEWIYRYEWSTMSELEQKRAMQEWERLTRVVKEQQELEVL